jgi:hypothetical protein
MALLSRKAKALHRSKCIILGCGRVDARKGYMCPRCSAWWRYHSLQSAAELSRYLNRVALAGNRIQRYRANVVMKVAKAARRS